MTNRGRRVGWGVAMAAATVGGGAQAADCPILESRNWVAWIDAVPGVDAERTLHITGEVDLPTPGYVADWRIGPADRRAVPSQVMELRFTPPSGVALQVVSTQEVAFQGPAVYPRYASIKIRCGDGMIAEITDIIEAQ